MPLFKDQLTAEIQALRLNAGKKSELLSLLDRAIQEETQKALDSDLGAAQRRYAFARGFARGAREVEQRVRDEAAHFASYLREATLPVVRSADEQVVAIMGEHPGHSMALDGAEEERAIADRLPPNLIRAREPRGKESKEGT